MRSALSGRQLTLAAGDYAAVVTECGAGLRSLTFQGEPLVLGYGPDEPAPAAFGQLLAPWPNRVDRGRYTWRGRDLQLDISEVERDCAIHGLARWKAWTPVREEADRAVLACRLLGSPGYPFRLALEAEYALDAAGGLTVRLTARNEGGAPAPYGHGAHPYLTVGEPIDGCTVAVPAREHLPVDERMIPRGPAEPVEGTAYDLRGGRVLGDRRIDRAFTGLERDAGGRARVRLTGSARTAELWLDDAHPWVEIYTADAVPAGDRRRGLGVEPMTCPPNALASGTGVVALDPGAAFTGTWGIRAG
ncbi:aldose 1-epimerase family protein [Actinomadura parmotrematis]|uniref:Aldose 1-epimerase family protein n=1 Tax=Actinomadura parmotrematis TaxID=2864039 RepID=A0ABS7FLK4_9ACTN|nr:aldose 1-epimerase family protein [Actinomadura parmotrematis]MBW8481234.1 aldose 1-epimerase family protein [Actinomadura parmotrematis]